MQVQSFLTQDPVLLQRLALAARYSKPDDDRERFVAMRWAEAEVAVLNSSVFGESARFHQRNAFPVLSTEALVRYFKDFPVRIPLERFGKIFCLPIEAEKVYEFAMEKFRDFEVWQTIKGERYLIVARTKPGMRARFHPIVQVDMTETTRGIFDHEVAPVLRRAKTVGHRTGLRIARTMLKFHLALLLLAIGLTGIANVPGVVSLGIAGWIVQPLADLAVLLLASETVMVFIVFQFTGMISVLGVVIWLGWIVWRHLRIDSWQRTAIRIAVGLILLLAAGFVGYSAPIVFMRLTVQVAGLSQYL